MKMAVIVPRSISAVSDTVLLERACCRKARVQLLWTMQLISSIQAEFALLARADDPLHTCSITKLPQVLYIWVYGNDFACTLMPSDTMSGIHHLHTKRSPFIMQERFVGRAETGPVDLDEDLT